MLNDLKINNSFKLTKFACYAAYFTMASVFCVPPMLFMTFREMYGISYTMLGSLVLTNFVTQLAVDLIFTLFAKHFNTALTVRVMPILTAMGLVIYALSPTLFPNATYVGLFIGTVIFSVSAGLSEVLLSPTIAAIPSENPQRDMSLLHSLYAFGVFTIVLLSSLFLRLAGRERWALLVFLLAALPLIPALLFMISPMPDMASGGKSEIKRNASGRKRMIATALCVLCIFLGSCAENTMSNWISGYMETALGIDKALGDILGVAMFAVLLGIARISYAKFGGDISKVLLIGMCGAAVCYLTVGLTDSRILAFTACVFTGLFTSMLWPGTLIMMEEKIPGAGVTAFALMAAGGDLGASFAPQMLGIITDKVTVSAFAAELGTSLGLSAEQIGLKSGMLISAIYPILGAVLVTVIMRYFKKHGADIK
ncbi:MAG: MFS transporter [Ruminococcaceae bacterium]|nr:MFS transporter [Oscillospiraceae bacterium]